MCGVSRAGMGSSVHGWGLWGSQGDMGTRAKPALPMGAFPSFSAAALKADLLPGLALQRGLRGSGICLSHYLLSKSRVWGGGEAQMFSPSSRFSAWTGHCSCPLKSRLLRGLPKIHLKSRAAGAFPNPPPGGHCKHVLLKAALLSAWHVPCLQIQLD